MQLQEEVDLMFIKGGLTNLFEDICKVVTSKKTMLDISKKMIEALMENDSDFQQSLEEGGVIKITSTGIQFDEAELESYIKALPSLSCS